MMNTSMKPKVCVISGSRADYGLLRNILIPLKKSKVIDTQFIVTGSHLSLRHGETIHEIIEDGITIDEEMNILSDDDSSTGIAKSFSKGLEQTTMVLSKLNPDIVLILGDRYEIFATAIAAMILNIPIAHCHGGESTQAAIDEAIRHSITKMSYLHFVAAEDYKRRVIQLGEDPKRVFFVGALGFDSVKNLSLFTKSELEQRFEISLEKRLLMITYHSVTLERDQNINNLEQILSALDEFKDTALIFSSPNADHDGGKIKARIEDYVKRNTNAYFFESLGQRAYVSFLNHADCVIGNSSSGIFEAPFCKVGSVNIGNRQRGRIKPKSVIDVPNDSESIVNAVKRVFSKDFREDTLNQENPFGSGNAGEKIVKILEKELSKSNKGFLKKEFFDIDLENI